MESPSRMTYYDTQRNSNSIKKSRGQFSIKQYPFLNSVLLLINHLSATSIFAKLVIPKRSKIKSTDKLSQINLTFLNCQLAFKILGGLKY